MHQARRRVTETFMKRVRSARGTRGLLLRSFDRHGNVVYVFRVHGPDDSFRDYNLLHSDLEVEIVDDEAVFYEDGEPRLDHSPKTLGKE